MRIALVSNTAWSLVNFRTGLIQRLVEEGHQVVAFAPHDESVSQLLSLGVKFRPIRLDNKGTNPARDLVSIFDFVRLFSSEQIDLTILYTIKPVIYGSLACRLLRVKVIAVITGLGTAFLKDGFLTRVVEKLYQIALAGVQSVFFLNDEDIALFLERKLISARLVRKIPGEGVNLSVFSPMQRPTLGTGLHFLFVGRMLRDKGLIEYVDAARAVKFLHPEVRFSLLGFVGVSNQSAISMEQVSEWVQEGVVDYLGATTDVRTHIVNADCIVLPSYREGISRALLEAMAMERPVIATDVVGCRELVDEGVNGYLCRPRDAGDLVRALEKFISLDNGAREEMGRRGRHKVSNEYDEVLVVDVYLEIIDRLAFGKGLKR